MRARPCPPGVYGRRVTPGPDWRKCQEPAPLPAAGGASVVEGFSDEPSASDLWALAEQFFSSRGELGACLPGSRHRLALLSRWFSDRARRWEREGGGSEHLSYGNDQIVGMIPLLAQQGKLPGRVGRTRRSGGFPVPPRSGTTPLSGVLVVWPGGLGARPAREWLQSGNRRYRSGIPRPFWGTAAYAVALSPDVALSPVSLSLARECAGNDMRVFESFLKVLEDRQLRRRGCRSATEQQALARSLASERHRWLGLAWRDYVLEQRLLPQRLLPVALPAPDEPVGPPALAAPLAALADGPVGPPALVAPLAAPAGVPPDAEAQPRTPPAAQARRSPPPAKRARFVAVRSDPSSGESAACADDHLLPAVPEPAGARAGASSCSRA